MLARAVPAIDAANVAADATPVAAIITTERVRESTAPVAPRPTLEINESGRRNRPTAVEPSIIAVPRAIIAPPMATAPAASFAAMSTAP